MKKNKFIIFSILFVFFIFATSVNAQTITSPNFWKTVANNLLPIKSYYLGLSQIASTSPTGTLQNGLMFYDTSTNKFRCREGGSWVDCIGAGAGSGITTLNSQTGTTQTFATGTATGIGLNIVSSGNVHTFTPTVSSGYSIPLTASTTQWAGLVNNPVWIVGASKIYNATSTDSVGIGTNSPSFALDVNSNVLGVGTKSASSGLGGQIRYRDDTGTARWLAGIPGSAGATDFYNSYNLLTSEAYITTTASGRVGIGTNHTAPLQALSVSSSSLASIPALGTNTAVGQFSVLGDSGGYGLRVGVLSTGNVFQQVDRFDGSATAYNLLLQPNGGNVGIGTTTPIAKLAVVGSAGNNKMFDVASSTGVSVFTIQPSGTTTIANLNQSACDVKATTGGDLYCGSDATGASSGNAAWTIGSALIYNATSTDSVGVGTSTPLAKFSVVGTAGATPILDIASSTSTSVLRVSPAGYVGLGNISPSYILDTYSTASSGINARIRGTGAVGLNIDASGSNDALLAFGTNSTAVWSIGYQGSNGNFNINKGSSLFNSPNFLTITNADGLLGLGTTTPLAKLAIVNIATTTVDAFDVASSSSTSFFRVKSNGNVGIGTTTPLAKLGIVGLSGNNPILDVATSTGASVLQVTVNSEVLLDPNAKLRLPASASQTLANAGQMYLDTSRGQIQFHDGTAQRVALQTRERTFTIASSTWNSYPATTFGMGTFFATTTITGIKCWVTGGTSVAFKMNDGTNDTDTLTCGTTVTSDDGSIANAGFNTNEKRYGVVGTVTGAVDYLTVTVQEREDAQ